MAFPLQPSRRQTRLPSLYIGFFLNGMAIVLTGALLPRLSQLNHLNDRQAGFLLATQSFGNFLGSFLVSDPPLRSLFTGTFLTFLGLLLAGFVVMGGSPLWSIYLCFLLFGYGLGEMATAINLIVGDRPAATRARHLSAINFLWSLGAIASPILLAALIIHLSVSRFLSLFSLPFLLLLPTFLKRQSSSVQSAEPAADPLEPAPQLTALSPMLFFSLLFLLYGGTEMSLSGWLASYAHRFAHASASSDPLAPAAFWAGITAGRGLGTILLPRLSEQRAATLSILACILSLAGLLLSTSTLPLLLFAAASGLALGPFFPAIVSWAIGSGLTPRKLGPLFAFCGLGATALPFLVGVASQLTSSLRIGLALPILYCAVILILFVAYKSQPNPQSLHPTS